MRITAIIGAAIFFAAMTGAAIFAGSVQCSAKWGDKAEFRVSGGCLVRTLDGSLVPEANYRVAD